MWHFHPNKRTPDIHLFYGSSTWERTCTKHWCRQLLLAAPIVLELGNYD